MKSCGCTDVLNVVRLLSSIMNNGYRHIRTLIADKDHLKETKKGTGKTRGIHVVTDTCTAIGTETGTTTGTDIGILIGIQL